MKINIFIFIALCSALFACATEKHDFEDYVISLSNRIETSKLEEYRKSDVLRENNALDIVFDEVYESVTALKSEDVISLYLDSISLVDTLRTRYVSIALHRFINNKSLKTTEIIEDYNVFALFRKGEKNKSHLEYVKSTVVKNDSLYKIGDTISALFRYDEDFGGKKITYNNLVPDSVYYSFENTIKLRAVLQNKTIRDNSSKKHDLNDIVFNCKIIEISSDDVWNSDTNLKLNVSFDLYLVSYGRPLGSSSDYDKW